jgi:quercetin dioxygenase-like cupin family protein
MTDTPHVLDFLPEYALGTLPEPLAAEVEKHVARCNPCARELALVDEIYGSLPLALPTPPAPRDLRARVLAEVARQSRFEALAGRVAGMLDVPRDRARELLEWVDDAARWVAGPSPSLIMHLKGGPRAAHANCGFVKLAAGASFPLHRHLGDEHVLVLQGGFEDSDGATLHRGDEAFKPAGSEHRFTALPGVDLVYLVVLEEGIDLPSDPGAQL